MNVDRSRDKVFNSASAHYPTRNPQPFVPTRNPQPFVAAVTLFGALVAGTGGIYSPENAVLVSQWTNGPAVTISSTPSVERKESAQEIGIPQVILQIRERLGLKMSEVANIFGVSRQAVYLWLRGENLRNEYVQRIWQLSRVAERLERTGIDRPEHFIHRPLSPDGTSLFKMLLSGADTDSALGVLEEQLRAEQTSRDKSIALRQDARLSRRDLSSVMELAAPILDEADG